MKKLTEQQEKVVKPLIEQVFVRETKLVGYRESIKSLTQ